MKKQYLIPETEILWVTTGSTILTGSNGEDLVTSSYGGRSDADDDVDNFWK